MSTRTIVSLLSIGLAVAGLGVAQAQEAAPVKIAFVDVEKAVVLVDEGKARLKELQDWAKPRQDELAKLNSDVTNLQGELASKRGVASEDALAEVNRRLVAKQREFEDKQRVGRRDFEQKQEGLLKDLGVRLNEVITRYADANRYTAVFILRPNELVYLANSADITDTVVKLYNERFPFPRPAEGAAK